MKFFCISLIYYTKKTHETFRCLAVCHNYYSTKTDKKDFKSFNKLDHRFIFIKETMLEFLTKLLSIINLYPSNAQAFKKHKSTDKILLNFMKVCENNRLFNTGFFMGWDFDC